MGVYQVDAGTLLQPSHSSDNSGEDGRSGRGKADATGE